MTRHTIATCGDPLTFRPVTSSLIRPSKDGNMQVVICLLGSHYNIKIDGNLQKEVSGDYADDTTEIAYGKLELGVRMNNVTLAKHKESFSAFMYFYSGLKIAGNIEIQETSDTGSPPQYEVFYLFEDLLSKDSIKFHMTRDNTKAIFKVTQTKAGTETTLYTVDLPPGKRFVDFEFVYLENGKSKLYTYANYGIPETQTKTRVWIGDITAHVGECAVSANVWNAENVKKKFISDYLFLYYPNIYLKYDMADISCKFNGMIKLYDTNNSLVEADWTRVRSRDHKFVGDRVVENAMVRLFIKTANPEIEVWGWDHLNTLAWNKVYTILGNSDSDSVPLALQNVRIKHFSNNQFEAEINFGTSIYEFIMTKGDPYVTMINKTNKILRIKSAKTRFAGDFGIKADILFDNSHYDVIGELNGTNIRLAQKVSNTKLQGEKLKTVLVRLKRSAAPTGSAEMKVRKVSDDSVVATSTNSVSPGNLTDYAEGENFEFTFAEPVMPAEEVYLSIEGGSYSGTNKLAWLGNGGEADINGASYTYDSNYDLVTSKSYRCLVGYVVSSYYSLTNTVTQGNLQLRSVGSETLTKFGLLDNWFALYNHASSIDVVGWLSNMILPEEILFESAGSDIVYSFTYEKVGNIFGVGILASYPSNLVSGIPFPFIVGTQDKYVKWPANEAVWAFKEIQTFRRR